MPAMIIHYNLTDADRRTIELMRANVARCAEVVGSLITEPTLAPGGSSLHYQGTVRMGPKDDGTCVCDTYGRVWSRTHLYVGGNGVIPNSTAANPTLTTVALAGVPPLGSSPTCRSRRGPPDLQQPSPTFRPSHCSIRDFGGPCHRCEHSRFGQRSSVGQVWLRTPLEDLRGRRLCGERRCDARTRRLEDCSRGFL